MFAKEDGPDDIFGKLRHMAGVRYDDGSVPYATNWFADGLICMYCNSMWFGAALWFLWVVSPAVFLFVGLPLALSAGSILIEGYRK